ncbi:hypothetical protein EGN72_02435 [Pseudorhodobacter sp. E13]|uniref:phage tail length tape measure family protein n=1 Tax=Pseudorhodobacter sp. E13 TaxID=2487931 RepID=UPI000F8E834C|nr:phage tail length tape measure family protein [Pseudorhodobacter sp. E13]RUS64868.1 hypothetical protein EGN72_02435 [Pseudorhodobacter sp. E13]
MTLTLGLLLTADAKGAKAELASTATEAKKLGTETAKAGREARGASGSVASLGSAGGAAAAKVTALANAEAVAGANALAMGQSHKIAAGSVGNLTAQFFDIGMMLQAGQNPLVLAIQQGTQISQVIGPMGAAGSVTALKSAFMGMINPVSLITIGSIAAGAAMIQWLTGAKDKATTLQDRLEEMADGVENFADRADAARAPWSELIEEFGSASPAVRQVLQDMAGLAKFDAYQKIDETSESVRELVLAGTTLQGGSAQAAARDFLGLKSGNKAAREMAFSFAQNLETLRNSADPAERLATALDLRDQLLGNSGGLKNLNGEQRELHDGLAAIIRDMSALGVQVSESSQPMLDDLRAVRDLGAEVLENIRARVALSADEYAKGAQVVASKASQVELERLTALYGAESTQVTEFRAEAERAVYAEMVRGLDISADMKTSLLESWDATAQSEAATYAWADAMGSVGAEINGILSALSQLGGGLIANASKVVELEALKSGKSVADARMTAVRSQIDAEYNARDAAAESWFDKSANWAEREIKMRGVKLDAELADERAAAAKREREANRGGRSGSGRSSGTSEVDKQRRALDELIAREERELELLRETDPVRKELLRNREALAGATEVEMSKVEDLIETRIRETDALKRMEWVSEQAGNALIDGLMGGADAGEQLIKTLERAILQAVILGDGPLGGLLGGSGGGGLMGSLFGAIGGGGSSSGGFLGGLLSFNPFAGGYASGGLVHGPGSGTSDEISARLSNGEFVMNAKSTARYRHLLEAMNTGSPIPGFAAGGLVGQVAAAPALAAAPMSFVINDYSGQKVEATQGTDSRGQPQITMTIGQQAAAAVSQRGNPLRRAMQSEFSMTPAVRQRG